MYSIDVTDHFEDFYVGSYTIGEYKGFKEALNRFFHLVEAGYWDGADSLEQFIDDEMKADEADDVAEWEWNCGFVLSLENEDGDRLLTHFTNYDYQITHMPIPKGNIEVGSSCLNSRDRKILASYGYDGSDSMVLYKLTDSSGKQFESIVPGSFGGHKKLKIYGRLDCPSALRYIAKGQYVQHRVFFADEKTAIAAGYRPCGVCMKEAYKKWKLINDLVFICNPKNLGKKSGYEELKYIEVTNRIADYLCNQQFYYDDCIALSRDAIDSDCINASAMDLNTCVATLIGMHWQQHFSGSEVIRPRIESGALLRVAERIKELVM